MKNLRVNSNFNVAFACVALAMVSINFGPVDALAQGIVSAKAKTLGGNILEDGVLLVRIAIAGALLAAAGMAAWKKFDGKWIVGLLMAALMVGGGPEILDQLAPKTTKFTL